ncbi:o-succinylbenzoate synthase [Brevibacterium sp. 91QC2O2]|uniref:o-succinylbenzoate synthase n=1 Tax=Brevibacterium sp. 91QC2O2 TaxID=2968458 RepID=UPI00211C4B1B|nr:o-succinylbenzoate synthase [Brevibacterium sp. 91QC2O2]MCQ9368248.1 o-succinylbenzoate synthase [Brevibacterium sp. 91QC2O2]
MTDSRVPPVPSSVPAPVHPDLPADPRELFDDIRVVCLPMVAKFRGITVREAMLVHGPAGWAEFSPFTEYDTAEASRWLAATVEYASCDYAELVGGPAAESAAVPALDPVPVNGTVPACPAADVPGILARYDGVRTVKIKVAERGAATLADDLARIRAVMAAGPQLRLRLDANGRYTPAEAQHALRAFAALPGFTERLEYIEQPVLDTEDLARLHDWVAAAGLPLRLAADESIRKASDPLRVARLGAADQIIVKVQPLGGIRAAREVVAAAGLPATVSSALDTSVGLAAGVALAAALRGGAGCSAAGAAGPGPAGGARLPGGAGGRTGSGASAQEVWAAGLGTSSLFARDVVDPPLRAHAGVLSPGRISPDPAALAALAAPAPRTAWWLERLDRCWAHLSQR